jgi:hypothetical protein
MGEADKRKEKAGRRFSQEQYDMLLRCSERKDMTEWNEWRKANPDEDILLEGADLAGVNLEDAMLEECELEGANLRADDGTLRKILEIEWQDHFQTRRQTWRTLEIEAALIVGLVGADFKFESAKLVLALGLLVVIATVCGILITINHRKGQYLKFKLIMRIERVLGLLGPGVLDSVKAPQKLKWSNLLTHINTPKFILVMHIAMMVFTLIYVVARLTR